MRANVLATCAVAIALTCEAGGGMANAAELDLRAGTQISAATAVRPGVYRLSDAGEGALRITGKGFTVDFRGARLVGDGKGVGIHIADATDVTLRNADVTGWHWGVVLERCRGVKLVDCTASRNGDLPPGSIIDYSGRNPEDQWGGGILIRDSGNCAATRCTAQHQWDGIDVVRSDGNVIEDGDYSYNGNWGIHLWNASKNVFGRNRAIWCTTGGGLLFQALTGWQTYDAQAVGIDHNSNDNLIEANDLRFGGDGIFIRANEGPITPGTVVPVLNGSHRNILRNNDCSFSPNNAIEVDLVDDTVIEGNNCSFSNYGMWLGYSRRCVVRENIAIGCSSHAVEIENGQNDLFENNVFGFDTERPDVALVYLRQNGRDKTPSGPYTFRNNLFYGSNTGVLLKATDAGLDGNTFLAPSAARTPAFVTGDPASHFTETHNAVRGIEAPSTLPAPSAPGRIRPGTRVAVSLPSGAPVKPWVIEVDGVPVQVLASEPGRARFWMPGDLWLSPAKAELAVRVLTDRGWSSPRTVRIGWPEDEPRIETIQPDPAAIGDTVTVTGANLEGRLLLNGKEPRVVARSPQRLVFETPGGILLPSRYNLVMERGEGDRARRSWPVTFSVSVPVERMPHLVSATFSPTTLKVGELLKVTFVVRNNLPAAAPLMTVPSVPFTYEERQAYWEAGINEQAGTLHLRVTSDQPKGHESGAWPWLFGFPKASLAPGETVEVVGYIRVETPGRREFRVGLVASGFRFIDDNAFRTPITVEPAAP